MKLRSLLSILFLLFFLPSLAQAQDITLSPCDQTGINTALSQVYNSGGGSVYLNAGTYDITGQIRIGSNTRLTGSQDAIIRVSSSSSQWFVDGVGIIGALDTHLCNVEIDSIQLDGNLRAFPSSYANSGAGDHNAERAIDFRCDSNNFGNNIKIHNLRIFDFLSDGIHLAFFNNVDVYANLVSDCQHSGIFFISVINGLMENNSVASITSDGLRFDNCENCVFRYNTLYSYTGDSGGAYRFGENLAQISDEGYSHNGGSDKPTHTTNIEAYGNSFSNDCLRTIWLDSAGKGVTNVYLHDNTGTTISTSGVSVGNISFTNPPTLQQSQQVFRSILDILKQVYSFQYLNVEVSINASVDITQYKNSYNPHSLIFVSGEGLTAIKYSYDNLSTTYYPEKHLWSGSLPNTGNSVYIQGAFDKNKLSVTVFNSKGFHKITDFNVSEVQDDSAKTVLNPKLWAFVGTLLILGLSIYRNLRRVITF